MIRQETAIIRVINSSGRRSVFSVSSPCRDSQQPGKIGGTTRQGNIRPPREALSGCVWSGRRRSPGSVGIAERGYLWFAAVVCVDGRPPALLGTPVFGAGC